MNNNDFNPQNFVQVGTDKDGNPLYQSPEAALDLLSALADGNAERRNYSNVNRKSNVSAVFVAVQSEPGASPA